MIYTVKTIKENKKSFGYWVMQGLINVGIDGEQNSVCQWIVRAECERKPTKKQRKNFIEKYKVYDVITSYFKNGFCIKQL